MSDVMTEAELEEAQAEAGEPEAPSDPGEEQADEALENEAENAVQEPEAQQAAGPSPEEIERTIGKIKTSANTFRRRVTELLGDEAQNLVPCELCEPDIPGFHWPAALIQPRDELHAHLLDVLRTPDAPDYSQAQHVRRCQLCDGWGVVLSGSRVANKKQVKCQMC